MFERRDDILQLAGALENAGHRVQAGRLRVLLNVFEGANDDVADAQAEVFLKNEPVPDDEALWLLLLEILDEPAALRYASDKLQAIQAGQVSTSVTTSTVNQEDAVTTSTTGNEDDTSETPTPRTLLEREGDARVYDAGVYQMLWDCGYCGTSKLLGLNHRFCPNCGGPQDTKWRYFPSEQNMVAVSDHKYVGKDVICPACATANAASADYCQQCGSPLTDGAKAKLHTPTPLAGDTTQASRKMSKSTLATIGGVLAAIVVVVVVLVTWTRDASVTVAAHTWEREIRIEDFAPRPQGGWCDGMPADAYRVNRSQRQRSTRQVADGETCNFRNVDRGDGTFRREQVCTTNYRSEPVYDDYCNYTVDRWAQARVAEAANSGRSPTWPELRLASNEREAGRSESYFLELRTVADDDSRDYRCEVSQDLWQAADEGSKWSLEVGAVAGEPRCNSLAPSR